MDRIREWLLLSYGKKLRRLHAWNAWIVLALAVSGVILFIPGMRGFLGEGRVILKQVHIGLGIVSVVLILLYLPLIAKHLKQLRGKYPQQWNLGIVLALLAGWSLSGLALWQLRNLPPAWSSTALFWHDLLTWVGVPYALYHSVTRSRWLRGAGAPGRRVTAIRPQRQADEVAAAAAGLAPAASASVWTSRRISRRGFLQWGATAVVAAFFGPPFYRWVKRTFDMGGTPLAEFAAEDAAAAKLLPEPVPLTDSLPPVGGGAAGNFRVYTVTSFPTITSDNFSFKIGGLVDHPAEWTWKQFLKIPRKVQVSDFYCVTGWTVNHVTWEGIPLSKLLADAGVKQEATTIKFYSADGVYTDSLSLEQAAMDDILVAALMDGQPIPLKLGGPVRLIVPKMYAYKSVKWLNAIELIDKDHIGYWEARGYDKNAWVKESRL